MTDTSALSPRDVYNVAKNQRRMLQLILVAIAINIVAFALLAMDSEESGPNQSSIGLAITGLVMIVTGIAVGISMLIVLVMLLTSMRVSPAVLVAALVCAFLPFFSVIVVLVAVSKANTILKRAGYKAGLLGVNSGALAKLRSEAALT